MIYDFAVERIVSLEETKSVARGLALKASVGDCYCLIGDLGAGKTEFARAFIQNICGEVTVSSPTFNILQIYEPFPPISGDARGVPAIYHFDLYRLKDAGELQELGLDDAFNYGITLIEWPQIAKDFLPENHVEIKFEIIDEYTRKIIIT